MAAARFDLQPRGAQPNGQLGHVIVELEQKTLGLLGESRYWTCVLESAGVNRDQEVAYALDLAEKVRGDHDGDAELASGALDEREHVLASRRVETVGRLVE